MATPRVMRFHAEGRPLEFSVWLLRARRLLESQVQAHETLWAHASGDLPEPADPAPLAADPTPADSDRYARERDGVRTPSEFLTAIKARYATPTIISLGRLFLPFLFPDLASFERTADSITHLRSLDSSYRTACTDAQLALLPPPMAITIYFIATSLPDRLASVRDALLRKHPSELTIEVLELALKDVESNLRSVASASSVVPPPLFHWCTFPQLPTFTASLATAATDVTAAAVTTSSRSRGRSGRRGGQGAGRGGGGSGGDVARGGGRSAGAGGAPRAAAGDSPAAAGEGDAWVCQPPTGLPAAGGARCSQPCGHSHPLGQCFSQLTDTVRLAYGVDGPAPDWLPLVQTYDPALWGMSASQLVDIFGIPHAMYAVVDSSASDSVYSSVVSLGASLAEVPVASVGTCVDTSPGATPEDASLSFTLDSGASHCFFRDCMTLTPLPTPVYVALANPTLGPVTARYTTTLPFPAVPSGSLTGFHVPSFSWNLVGVRPLVSQHVGVWIEPSGETAVCVNGDTAAAAAAAAAVATAPNPCHCPPSVAASCSCRSLAYPTVLWHHRMGHPPISRLRAMSSQRLVLGLPRVLPLLPPSLAQPCSPCVEGRLCATPHSSSLRPANEPFETLHLDVWGPASRPGPERESFFLVVVGDYSRYTTVFPLAKKSDVNSMLIRWLLTTADTRGRRVSCLHSDHGGEFRSGILVGFCREQGIRQSWTLPQSPQQNGVAERRIGLVMEIVRTSMTQARAPHFCGPTRSPGAASRFHVWGCLALVRDTSADKISPRAVSCVFLGFPEDSSDYTFYHPPLHQFFDSRDIRFDESVPYYVRYPCRGLPVPPAPLFLTSVPLVLPRYSLPPLVLPRQSRSVDLGSGGRSPVVLTGHADASWADDQATQRSSQGYTFGLGSGSVSWRATRSSSVLGSSCEAEIYAGAMAAQELRWLTYPLTDLGEPPRSPPVRYVDNKAMLALCREQRLEHRTKHIALRYFLARELQQRGQLRLAYVASEANTADVFTKALAPCDHQRCCTQLGLLCFALLDWSCDPLFSPTLPMGGFLFVLTSFIVNPLLSFFVLIGFCGEDPGGASSRGAGVGAESVPLRGPGSGGAGVGAELVTAGDSSLRGAGVSGAVPGGATTGGAPSAGPREPGTDPVTSGGAGSGGGASGSLESGPGATTAPDTAPPPHPYPTRHQARVRRAREEQLQLEREERELEQQQPEQEQPQQPPPPPPVSGLRTLGLPSPSPPSPPSPPVSGPPLPPPDPSPAVFPPPLPPLSPPLSHTWPSRCSPRARPSSRVPFTDLRIALFNSSPPYLSPYVLPSPPELALTASLSTPVTDYYHTYRPVLSRVLASLVTDSRASLSFVSALTAAVTEFASTRCLDYATSLVAAPPTSPLAIGGESALGCDALEDRQFELEFLAAASPHLCAMLLAPEGDPDALYIPTPRTYAEAVPGPWASQWRAAMDSEMASYRSTGTYARYMAKCFSQREGVDFFHTFAPIPKMTTLRVLFHVVAQRDYELHSLDFSTAFLQGSLYEEFWLRRPSAFTDTFPPRTQWRLRRLVYGLRQAPREWHDTLRSTLSDLGFQPSSADSSLFVCCGSTPFFVLVYVDDLVFATANRVALADVKLELQKRHTCTDLGELRHYLGLHITRDRAARTITLSQSHMVQQVLQRFELQHSTVQCTPLAIDHRLTGPFPDELFEPSGPHAELVGYLMYVMTCTRPDLAFPLSILALFVAPGRHRPVHWTAAVRVAKYLAMTSGVGLVLGGR
ncbi:unnamed protein product [Closterium sp. NIES-53]